MWQKGPGEGYMAAKEETLAIDPTLRCERLTYNGRQEGFIIRNKDGRAIGTGKLSRDAWGDALWYLRNQSTPTQPT